MPGPVPAVDAKWAGLGRLILGSKSWSRRTLLSELGVPPFDIIVPDIDESSIRSSCARELVVAIGNAKALALLSRPELAVSGTNGKTLMICGDSVVKHKDMILEKPRDEEEARGFLRSYATAPATTVSSVVVVDVEARRKWEGVDEAEVYFREMPEGVIEELISTGGSMESAGGLRIEHPRVQQYTECIIGHRSAVMGFSQPLVEQMLKEALVGEGGQSV